MRTGPIGYESEELPAFYWRIFRRLEQRKQKMLDMVGDWAPEWLTYAPQGDGWSMLQVLDHLIRTERSVRETSERNVKQRQNKPSTAERWRARGLLLLFLLPIRVRAPGGASFVQPASSPSLDDVLREWSEERQRLYEFLQQQRNDRLNFTAMQHPVVGAMNLRDALRFLAVHLWHHQFQVLRLRKAISQAFVLGKTSGLRGNNS